MWLPLLAATQSALDLDKEFDIVCQHLAGNGLRLVIADECLTVKLIRKESRNGVERLAGAAGVAQEKLGVLEIVVIF